MRLRLPDRLDRAGGFKPVQGRVERPFLEPQQSATGFFQAVQDLEAVRLAPFQGGKDHRFKMATQFVTVDRVHAFILDRLGIRVKGALRALAERSAKLPGPPARTLKLRNQDGGPGQKL